MGELTFKKYTMKIGKEYILRTTLPTDSEKVLEFNKTIISEEPYLLTSEEEFKLTIEQQKDFLQKMLEDEGKLAILAEFNGEVIGTLDFHNGHKKRIKHQGSFGMSVKKEFRNQGVGKALLTELLDWAKNNPLIEKVCLEVFSENNNAIELYKNFGFVVEGHKKKAIKLDKNKYFDLILMAHF